MSTPPLHSASVSTTVPSPSMIAWVKNSGGCSDQTPQPRFINGIHQVQDLGLMETAAEVPGGSGVRDALGAYGIEIDLVVAPQFDVLDPFATRHDVERDIQDVVGFVVGQMPLEDVDLGVDVADQPGPLSQHEHCTNTPSTEALDTISQFIVDVGCGHHGLVPFWPRPIQDAVKDSPLALAEDSAVAFSRPPAVPFSGLCPVAFWGSLGDSSSHSKASGA